ncbi:MAG: PqqD family protein [Myxococcales bacterium]|nr:PqqD family protein [Myxococcales bacterium]MCB9693016.1 PqqD family protein [Alphaproteobacteria bacterium]
MTRYHRAQGVASADLGGETTLMEPTTGVYFGLDRVGAEVWSLLEGRTLDELVERLVAEYDVEPDRCRADVLELLEALEAKRLVRSV